LYYYYYYYYHHRRRRRRRRRRRHVTWDAYGVRNIRKRLTYFN